MTVRELRRKYLDFFIAKGHSEHASGSLVPYDVTGRLDESLLFNGAGMVQFKPYFRGAASPPNRRLATSQKCLRTGDIEEVGDDSHLTFFEMLGNFSFGGYFKREAIAYSWEFLTSTEWLGLDPRRLAFTIFSEDDEAESVWAAQLTKAGIDPATRIFRLGEETNYWPAGSFSKGPPGPCGPNSEMFYWTGEGEPPSGPYSAEDYLRDESEGKWLEIWNDVFIQYEWQGDLRDPARPDKGYEKRGLANLPFRSIDTGMGIERTVAVLNGFRSVYDTDAFQPIFRALEELKPGLAYGSDAETTRAMRIIADHLRAATFCIADGVLPSNGGRGYVLRRLIRRAVLKGVRQLTFDRPFLSALVSPLIEIMGGHYHELVERQATVMATLRGEEDQFRRTLDQGSAILTEWLEPWRTGIHRQDMPLAGDRAFMLYDTYGFPLEVTQEVCAEAGVTVDAEGYRTAMAEAQARSRGASGMDTVYGGVGEGALLTGTGEQPSPTIFTGYTHTKGDSEILALRPGEGGTALLALAETPFYAESGGQVGDRGALTVNGFHLLVEDVAKDQGVFVHRVRLTSGDPEGLMNLVGQTAHAQVDSARRREITRHHTATHLLHAALRERLGTHVTQAGSRVDEEELRFDFTHGAAMTDEELADVESWVNTEILKAQAVLTYPDVPIDEARAMGAMALFGEKYADRVRVVQIGDMTPTEPSLSRELCGGVHVPNTGQIGLFKIRHESSAAGGVRRIVAVAGDRSATYVRGLENQIARAAHKLKSSPAELETAIEKLQETLKEERRKRERLAQQGGAASVESVLVGPVTLLRQVMDDADAADAKAIADRLIDQHPAGVALMANRADGKVTFVVKVGPEALKSGAHAGNLVKAVATAAGGGGGGRPDFATAGGRDPGAVDAALEAGRAALAGMVGG